MLKKLLKMLFKTKAKSASELADIFASAKEYHQQGILDNADKLYQKVLANDPTHFDALQLLGLLKQQQGQHNIAIELLNRAITINPNFYAVYVNLAAAYSDLNDYEEALKNHDIALTLQPNNLFVLSNKANVLFELQRYEEAINTCDAVLSIAKDDVLALTTRGNALMKLQYPQQALANYEQALFYANINASTPIAEHINLLNNKGLALLELHHHEEALVIFNEMLILSPNHPTAFLSRGNCLFHLQRFQEAIDSFEKSIVIHPSSAAHLNQGLCRLILGDFARGWQEYEWRTKNDNGIYKLSIPGLLWTGNESLSEKTIFLYAEQGLGDSILMLRYINNISALGAKIILNIQPPLKSIASTLEGIEHIIIPGEYPPNYDYHCPLMSLPLAFQTNINSIPNNIPYLFTSKDKREYWEQRIGDKFKKYVGIVWSGNPDNKTDQDRSIKLMQLLHLKRNNVALFCLKKDISAADKKTLNEHNIAYFDNEIHDFSDTAALVDCMDLIISVDTSVAHLAGAMGKPTWVLLANNADWRWLLERTDSPWYPSVRLFRQQQPNDWAGVLEEVEIALDKEFLA